MVHKSNFLLVACLHIIAVASMVASCSDSQLVVFRFTPEQLKERFYAIGLNHLVDHTNITQIVEKSLTKDGVVRQVETEYAEYERKLANGGYSDKAIALLVTVLAHSVKEGIVHMLLAPSLPAIIPVLFAPRKVVEERLLQQGLEHYVRNTGVGVLAQETLTTLGFNRRLSEMDARYHTSLVGQKYPEKAIARLCALADPQVIGKAFLP